MVYLCEINIKSSGIIQIDLESVSTFDKTQAVSYEVSVTSGKNQFNSGTEFWEREQRNFFPFSSCRLPRTISRTKSNLSEPENENFDGK